MTYNYVNVYDKQYPSWPSAYHRYACKKALTWHNAARTKALAGSHTATCGVTRWHTARCKRP